MEPIGSTNVLRGRIATGLATVLAGVVCLPGPVYAQTAGDPPEAVGMRLGPLALAPAIALNNIGWDSNVFQLPVDLNPVGDFTFTFRPELQGWLRLGRARATFNGAVDFAYFRDYSSERSADTTYYARIELPDSRINPYVSTRGLNGKQRFSFEIDERTRRKEETYTGGVIVRLGKRTQVDVAGVRRRFDFTHTDTLVDPLISDFYDYTSHGLSLTVRRDLTPLTTLTVAMDGHQDEFDVGAQRNSKAFGVTSGLEFKPFALLNGRALFGWNRVELDDVDRSIFSGFVTSVDLAYTLLGSTRLGIQAERGLSYSAMRGQHAFLLERVKGSVVHRLSADWDIGGSIGRYRASYGLFLNALPLPDDAIEPNREIVTDYGGELGYRLGPHTRIAGNAIHYRRRSTISGREYRVTRAGMSIAYRF